MSPLSIFLVVFAALIAVTAISLTIGLSVGLTRSSASENRQQNDQNNQAILPNSLTQGQINAQIVSRDIVALNPGGGSRIIGSVCENIKSDLSKFESSVS